MSNQKSTVRKLKPQERQLTQDEVKRIAEKLAVALEHDEEHIALLLLLFDHLEEVAEKPDPYLDLWGSLFTIKQHLFVGTPASGDAQKKFHAESYANRGKLLLWPYERKGAK